VLIASAIQGQGGIGKTILAQLLAYDGDVQTRFPDGIYWLTFGQKPESFPILAGLIESFDPNYKPSTETAASAHLGAWLADRSCLLILDDVWQAEHVKPFLTPSGLSRFLLTTRRTFVATDLHARRFYLGVMTPEEALNLFEERLSRPLAGSEREQALQLAEAVGRLPLALNLAAARVGEDGVPWQELTRALKQEVARLEKLEGSRRLLSDQPKLEATLNLSLHWLQARCPEVKTYYAWFGVLPEDAVISAPMAATLWGISQEDAADYLDLLQKEALLLLAADVRVAQQAYRGYRLHDLFHDIATRLMVMSKPEGSGLPIVEAHEQLLKRYLERHKAWAGWCYLTHDGYIHERLCWHLEQAKQISAMVDLFGEENNGRNGWYEARERTGQTAGYIQDLFRALKQVQSVNDQLTPLKRIESLTTELRFVLCLGSLNSLAENIPNELLVALVRFRVWDPLTALAYIRQKPDIWQRAQALIAIAPLLSGTLVQQALEAARQIEHAYMRSEALSGIASALHTLPSDRFYRLWKELLRTMVTHSRQEMLSTISALTPSLLKYGGPKAVDDVVVAIQDVARWWP
jgi:hypothetical protein